MEDDDGTVGSIFFQLTPDASGIYIYILRQREEKCRVIYSIPTC